MIFLGAPKSDESQLFNEMDNLCHTTNCYAYAVQDYGAGYIEPLDGDHQLIRTDELYLPRPGQSTGKSYDEIYNVQENLSTTAWYQKRKLVMRQALKQDGILFQGVGYPTNVPNDKYVICCFLVQNSYHFLRQNQDGSWSGKNGPGPVSKYNYAGTRLLGTDAESYFDADDDCAFVGYFFVPKGGVRVGIKSWLMKKHHRRCTLVRWLQREASHNGMVVRSKQIDAMADYLTRAIPLFESSIETVKRIRSVYENVDTVSLRTLLKNNEQAHALQRELDCALFDLKGRPMVSLQSSLVQTRAVSLKRRRKMV